MKLSGIIPCYNEENQIGKNLAKKYNNVLFIQHTVNRGKGASLRTGIQKITGDVVIIQDADLEYSPEDLPTLLTPLINGKADVVIGSRFLTVGPHRVLYFWHSIGNKFLTFLSNMFSDLNLTDVESGYKLFRSKIIKNIEIEEDRFGFEPEIIAKVAHMNLRIYEIGISYFGRTYAEGKKINYKDGFRALYCIFKYNTYYATLTAKIFIYLLIASITILINVFCFTILHLMNINLQVEISISFILSALITYPFIFFDMLGKHKKFLKINNEFFIIILIVILSSYIDIYLTQFFIDLDITLIISKIYSLISIIVFCFFLRILKDIMVFRRRKIA